MSPKVVCQQSFFTLSVHPPTVAQLLLGQLHLALRPCLQRLLPQPPELIGQSLLGVIGALQIPVGVLHHPKQCRYALTDLGGGAAAAYGKSPRH